MKALPEEFDESEFNGLLADGWGFDVETADYAPLGFGSYHWVVTDGAGTPGFVTVDDLDRKPWLGETRESAFHGLRRAFETALALRDGGLDFVVAPIPTNDGETVIRAGRRHTIALFPFVAGQAGRYGQDDTANERAAVVTMLAELHRATPVVAAVARSIDLALPGRQQIDSALQALGATWSGGPFSEPARQALVRYASDLDELLAIADRLSGEIRRRCSRWVVTHGEPHAANVMRTGGGHVLIDWDTVALAPPERDLWMVVGDDGDEAALYADATGHELDQVAIDFFRLTWDLADIAAFTDVLRSPHRRSEDTNKAYEGLKTCLATRDQRSALLD